MNESIRIIRTKIHTYVHCTSIHYLHTYMHTYIHTAHPYFTFIHTIHAVHTYSTYVKSRYFSRFNTLNLTQPNSMLSYRAGRRKHGEIQTSSGA